MFSDEELPMHAYCVTVTISTFKYFLQSMLHNVTEQPEEIEFII